MALRAIAKGITVQLLSAQKLRARHISLPDPAAWGGKLGSSSFCAAALRAKKTRGLLVFLKLDVAGQG